MLAVSNLGYFSFISGTACPPFSKYGFLIHFSGATAADDAAFALDHAPSKYVQIEQSTDTFTAFSHVQYPGSHVTLYTVFLCRYWRLDTLFIMYS